MFEKACYQRLDEPVLVWLGLEFGEVVAAISSGAGTAVLACFVLNLGFVGILAGFGAGAALVGLFRTLRRGGPGGVFAKLYRLGLIEHLPGRLRPRHLLPLCDGARSGKVRLSAVAQPEGSRIARLWWGR